MTFAKHTPEKIWLLLNEGDGGDHVWCDDPDPTGTGEIESIQYNRADTLIEIIRQRDLLLEALSAYEAAIHIRADSKEYIEQHQLASRLRKEALPLVAGNQSMKHGKFK